MRVSRLPGEDHLELEHRTRQRTAGSRASSVNRLSGNPSRGPRTTTSASPTSLLVAKPNSLRAALLTRYTAAPSATPSASARTVMHSRPGCSRSCECVDSPNEKGAGAPRRARAAVTRGFSPDASSTKIRSAVSAAALDDPKGFSLFYSGRPGYTFATLAEGVHDRHVRWVVAPRGTDFRPLGLQQGRSRARRRSPARAGIPRKTSPPHIKGLCVRPHAAGWPDRRTHP